MKTDDIVKTFARRLQRQLCGYDGEAATVREAEIEDAVYRYFGRPHRGGIDEDSANALQLTNADGLYITVATDYRHPQLDAEYSNDVLLFVLPEAAR